jgi:hypothetical protein
MQGQRVLLQGLLVCWGCTGEMLCGEAGSAFGHHVCRSYCMLAAAAMASGAVSAPLRMRVTAMLAAAAAAV